MSPTARARNITALVTSRSSRTACNICLYFRLSCYHICQLSNVIDHYYPCGKQFTHCSISPYRAVRSRRSELDNCIALLLRQQHIVHTYSASTVLVLTYLRASNIRINGHHAPQLCAGQCSLQQYLQLHIIRTAQHATAVIACIYAI
jgi:hypothetical protein